jgi:hypothetical protein
MDWQVWAWIIGGIITFFPTSGISYHQIQTSSSKRNGTIDGEALLISTFLALMAACLWFVVVPFCLGALILTGGTLGTVKLVKKIEKVLDNRGSIE